MFEGSTIFNLFKLKLNKTERYIFLFIFFFHIIENSSAQKVLKISSIDEANKQIENYIYLYSDTTNTLDITQILNKREQNYFCPLVQFTKKRSSKNTYWLYLSIENNINSDSPLGLSIPKQDHLVDIYTFSDSTLFFQQSGFYMDVDRNDEIIPFSNSIRLKNTRKIDLYLKINNINDELPVFSLKFVNIEKAIKQNNRLIVFDGFAFGMMWVMIMYGLFLFFLNKDKIYFYYSFYIILISIWYFGCLALGYRLIPNLPRRIFPYTDIPLYIGYIFYIQFIRLFINTSQILPKWDKILKLIQVVLSVEAIGLPISIYLTKLTIANYIFANIVVLAIIAFIGIFNIKLFSIRNKLASIIAIGSSFLVLGALLSSILFILLLNDNVFIIQKLGTLSELLVFTFGISYRYSLIEADKKKFSNNLLFNLVKTLN